MSSWDQASFRSMMPSQNPEKIPQTFKDPFELPSSILFYKTIGWEIGCGWIKGQLLIGASLFHRVRALLQ